MNTSVEPLLDEIYMETNIIAKVAATLEQSTDLYT